MQIEPITVQSVAYTTVHHGDRTVTTRREHAVNQGYQTVSEIAYVIYTRRGEIAAAKPAHQVDLYV